ncbi:MAG: metallophosphoesterase family protein [Oscillospiraceae bacterium]
MAKILHTADFHLDSAFTALPEEKARLRRQEARQLTDRLVDYANDHGVELLLLAGDLFDSDQLYGQTAQELARSLARFRGHAVIAPGNHDFYAASSPYARLLWPENVHIFREERLQRLPFPQYGCVVYGAAFTAPAAPAGLPGSLDPEDEGLARILLLHGEVGVRDSRYRAMTLKTWSRAVPTIWRWATSTPSAACSRQDAPFGPIPAARRAEASTSWGTRASSPAPWSRDR